MRDEWADDPFLSAIRDGTWLAEQDFPPLRWTIPGLLPEGMALLIGAPKVGKSWLALSLLLAVATGETALGQLVMNGAAPALYLALEDSDRRMRDRCALLLGDEPGAPLPPLFGYLTAVEPGTLLTGLERYLTAMPDTRLVVVDTLGKVMPPAMVGESAYQRDYRIGGALKRLADDHPGLAVLVLHHDRKATVDDFVDSVSGTHGLAGSADTIMVIGRERNSEDGSLKITGRDVPENEYALSFADGHTWQLAGESLDGAASEAHDRQAGAVTGKAADVLAFIRESRSGVRSKETADKFGPSAFMYLKRLTEKGLIESPERGLYCIR